MQHKIIKTFLIKQKMFDKNIILCYNIFEVKGSIRCRSYLTKSAVIKSLIKMRKIQEELL